MIKWRVTIGKSDLQEFFEILTSIDGDEWRGNIDSGDSYWISNQSSTELRISCFPSEEAKLILKLKLNIQSN